MGEESAFVPFDPDGLLEVTERHLPHWHQPNCTYFVTFRLADSLPRAKYEEWVSEREQWLRAHAAPLTRAQKAEYYHRFPERLQQWLDGGYGNCWLREPRIAGLVESSLTCFDGDRYLLSAYVIMPNHVHALVKPLGDQTLTRTIRGWKSFSARGINDLLGRRGTVWQPESFDHIVRNLESMHHFDEYIRLNPMKGGLVAGEYRIGAGKLCTAV